MKYSLQLCEILWQHSTPFLYREFTLLCRIFTVMITFIGEKRNSRENSLPFICNAKLEFTYFIITSVNVWLISLMPRQIKYTFLETIGMFTFTFCYHRPQIGFEIKGNPKYCTQFQYWRIKLCKLFLSIDSLVIARTIK